MNFYKRVVQILTEMKKSGVAKGDALDCLEFDSDEYPDMNVLNRALNEVYGE